MTVKELIEKLKEFDPDYLVYVGLSHDQLALYVETFSSEVGENHIHIS